MPAPVPSELAAPITAGVVAVGLFLGSVVRGWSNGKKPSAEHATDTVVVSASLADGRPIRELAEAIESFNRSQSDRSEALLDAMRDVVREQQRTTRELQTVNDSITRGVRVSAAPP